MRKEPIPTSTEIWKILKEVSLDRQKTERQMQETDRRMQATDRQMKETGRQIRQLRDSC